METLHDNCVTTREAAPNTENPHASEPAPDKRPPKAGKDGRPAATVRHGSTSVPVYRCRHRGSVRFIISFHREGKRVRRSFGTLDKAKKEALLVAQRIQSGLQHVTDMAPHDRDAYAASVRLLEKTGIPLVAAIQEYVAAKGIAGTETLVNVATIYSRHFARVVPDALVPDIVAALIDGETTLKRYVLRHNRPYLKAENRKYPDLVPAHELVIQGVLVMLLRLHSQKRAG